MPDLKTLRILDRMPALYRDALDRRCRAASGYSGKRPWADQLVDWSPETDDIERLKASVADLDTRLASARTAWTEAQQLYRVNRSVRHQRTMTKLGKQAKALKKQRSGVAARITLGRQRRAYYDVYASIADTIVRHIDVRLIPLIEGLPEQLRVAGRQRANDYRVFLLQDQFDAAEIEIDDDGLEYRVGIDELLPLVEPRRFARRLRRDAGMAALHLGCLLGLIGGDQLYAPDLLVSVSREQDRRTWEWAKGHRLVERLPGQPEPGQEPFSKPLIEVIQNKLDARYATMWSLIKATEQHAEREGLACLFVTMTLPPEYHPNPSHGGRSWNPALSPVRGAEELQDRWHRMLARARKAGVPVLGLWTLEPHKDGAPHRHAMIWLRPEDQAWFLIIVRDEFPDPEGQESFESWCNIKDVMFLQGTRAGPQNLGMGQGHRLVERLAEPPEPSSSR